MKHESYREGGVNDYEHKLITQVSYPRLFLNADLRWTIYGSGRKQ